jgi:tRNA modification GTPase
VIPSPQDTIAAISSPPGASARAVVRLSGERAWALAGRVFAPLPERGWRWRDGALTLPGWPPAPATAVVFRAPRSYTGEDLVELWVTGAPPLVRRLLLTLTEAGARLAERGEFTRRAFLAGRLDLTQVEAVLTLTTSDDARAARGALRALGGGLGRAIDFAKAELVEVIAHVEAAIDFSEEDLDLAAPASLAGRLDAVGHALGEVRGAGARRPSAGTLPRVALRGPANAGKSSLFNALLGRAAALVADGEGTTRDVVEAEWTLPGGRKALLLDTAGDLASAPGAADAGSLDARATDRARAAEAEADLVVWVVDGERGALPAPADALPVITKADLEPLPLEEGGSLRLSSVTRVGLAALGEAVEARLWGEGPGAAGDLLGSARQEGLLLRAEEALGRASGLLRGRDPARAELAAVDLAEALDALGELTGEVTRDDVLGRIFAGFCVGK